jgi:phenylpyruvate tautomerase PptA (4-oxalocrotonate tautomerase family)
MPFVTINVLEGKGKDYIKKISDCVNEAVIETMSFPDDDRYQVVNQLSEDCMQYQGRQEERIMMHLVMRSGRPNKAKQAFYKKVVEYLHERVGIKPKNVFITITENHDVDFSFKDGIAQFVV